MAFTNTNYGLQAVDGGELVATSPYGVTAYTSYESGLQVGRVAQLKAGVLSNLDGTAAPVLVGAVLRDLGSAVENGTALINVSSVDVCDFGRTTIYLATGANPTELAPVYVVNAVGVDAGKVTQDSAVAGAVLVTGVVFYKQVKTGVWTITLKNYLR